MLAESIHSFADCGNQVLLYVGLIQSTRPPDVEHPMGYGQLTYFWSFIVALMLFSLGGVFSIVEGVHKLSHSAPLTAPWIALSVLAVSLLLESISLLGCLREIRTLRGAQSLRSWLATTRNAELVVVLGEDCAALLGLILAFSFVGAAAAGGQVIYDALGSIAIGVVLVCISIFVALRIKGLLVGRSAEPELRRRIEVLAASHPQIEAVLNSITIRFGPKIMLALKIKMRAGLSLDEAVQHINALEASLRREVPDLGWCFVEPDDRD
jgi:cation diffusion facilitator family transporter